MLHDEGTGYYVSISGNSTRDGARAVQTPYLSSDGQSYLVGNETFYLHPTPR
ncbi:RICIN domain-containing protein [Streptomyces sp. cg2]|uniref:RICIN domain-containing protein n=1 Tax=Streptomyces sp. cg2 TaxID=3238799 RepID=UPI0034E29F6B